MFGDALFTTIFFLDYGKGGQDPSSPGSTDRDAS
jgi:hypothetical protein